MSTLRVLASFTLLLACTPKPADTDGESSSSFADTDGAEATSVTAATAATAGPTTSGTATTPTTEADTASSGTGDTHGGSTTSPGATTGIPSTTGFEPSTSTGGDTEGGLPGACGAVCAHWDMCAPGTVGPVEQCTASCSNGSQEPSGCAEAMTIKLNCVAGLSCEEALKFFDGEPTSCLEEANAADRACIDLGCGGEVGGGMETCELQQDCEGEKQQYVCDGDTCTCIENDVPAQTCASEGFCALDSLEQREAIAACCGWEWKV